MSPLVIMSSEARTDRHGVCCMSSAVAHKLRSRDTADDSVHAPRAWTIPPAEGHLGLALGQGDLHSLTLHLLHPVGLLGDLSLQSDKERWT